MKLRNKICQDINWALKKKEKAKLEILRFLKAQIENREIEQKRKPLSDKQIISLIAGQIKKLKESLAFFKKGKREDLIQKSNNEIKVLKAYLPQQLSDEKLEREVEKIIKQNSSISNPGALIGICVKTLAGRADNQKIARMVQQKIKSS